MNLFRRRLAWVFPIAALVLLAAVLLTLTSAPQPSLPLPSSMAAIGDSITQGVATSPQMEQWAGHSWAAGDADDEVESHYERITEQRTASVTNVAVAGAKMADAPVQASEASRLGVDYVTFLLGANDVCTSSTSTMTSTASFRRDFERALAILDAANPAPRVLVVSIPDVSRLWELFGDNPAITSLWERFSICQSVLSPSLSDVERQEARQRNREFNAILEEVCDDHARCRFDGNAVFDYRFTPDQVSDLDHFHPSVAGQGVLAEIAWERGFWGP